VQKLGEGDAGELTALIGIHDVESAVLGDNLAQRLQAKGSVERVG